MIYDNGEYLISGGGAGLADYDEPSSLKASGPVQNRSACTAPPRVPLEGWGLAGATKYSNKVGSTKQLLLAQHSEYQEEQKLP